MAGESHTTTDHKVIQKWVEARGGKPVTVKSTGDSEEPGILRIDFPGGAGSDRLEEISWEQFFEKFDEKKLAFLYQEKTSGGEESRFFKLISRDTADEKHGHENHKANGKHEAKHDSNGKHEAKHDSDDKSKSKTEHEEKAKAAKK